MPQVPPRIAGGTNVRTLSTFAGELHSSSGSTESLVYLGCEHSLPSPGQETSRLQPVRVARAETGSERLAPPYRDGVAFWSQDHPEDSAMTAERARFTHEIRTNPTTKLDPKLVGARYPAFDNGRHETVYAIEVNHPSGRFEQIWILRDEGLARRVLETLRSAEQ